MFLIGAYLSYNSLHASRRYLAMHTEAQLDKHFCRSLAVIGSVIGPVVYLYAETIGCYMGSVEEELLERCERLLSSNWTTAFNLVMFCVSHVAFEIEHLDVTTDDVIALRKKNAGSVVRGLLQGTALVISLVVFGARPRDIYDLDELTEKYEAELVLLSIVDGLKYTVVLLWIVVMVWQTAHVNQLIMSEQESIGEMESDELVGRKRWAAEKWHNLMSRLNAWMEKNAVGEGEARMSPVYSSVVGFLSYVLIILPIFVAAAILLSSNKGDIVARNYASLMYHLSVDFKLVASVLVGIFAFMDLEVAVMTDGRDGNKNNKWQYRDFHVCIVVLSSIVDACVSSSLYGHTSALNIMLIATSFTLAALAIYRRRKALATATFEQRLYHVKNVVFPASISIAPTLIYMTSEMAACQLFALTRAQIERNSLGRENECDGINHGIFPLLLILCALHFGKVVFVNVRSAFTTKTCPS